MGIAKLVSMHARPWKVSQLCFEIGGILEQLNVQLGDSVGTAASATAAPFNFTSFYSGLGAHAVGTPSLLTFNSAGILSASAVTASLIATLRAESRQAALDKAVYARQNAYYARYSNISSVVTTATGYYGSAITAKPALLQQLATLSAQQATLLEGEYVSDGRTTVVKTTNSVLSSTTLTTESSSSSGSGGSTTTPNLTTQTTGQSNQDEIGGSGSVPSGGLGLSQPPPGGGAIGTEITGASQVDESFQEGSSSQTSTETGTTTETDTNQESAIGSAYAVENETIVNTDYGYRVPYIECQAQNARAQISLIDQQFAQFMAGQNLSNLGAVLGNELSIIDLTVQQLQVAFINTLLLSPIAGTVTGLYKFPGDPVLPGEPVVRLEDNSTLLLCASLIYRDPIYIGSTVTISTSLFDETGPQTNLAGSVVAVRGKSEDDHWDVVVQCPNPATGSGGLTFPIGYHFDYAPSITTVTIT